MPVGASEIRRRFGYHPATDRTAAQHNRLREAYIAFGEFLDEVLPDGRAKSTAFTSLQQSSMWANFGIAEQAPVVVPEVGSSVKTGNSTPQTPPSEASLL